MSMHPTSKQPNQEPQVVTVPAKGTSKDSRRGRGRHSSGSDPPGSSGSHSRPKAKHTDNNQNTAQTNTDSQPTASSAAPVSKSEPLSSQTLVPEPLSALIKGGNNNTSGSHASNPATRSSLLFAVRPGGPTTPLISTGLPVAGKPPSMANPMPNVIHSASLAEIEGSMFAKVDSSGLSSLETRFHDLAGQRAELDNHVSRVLSALMIEAADLRMLRTTHDDIEARAAAAHKEKEHAVEQAAQQLVGREKEIAELQSRVRELESFAAAKDQTILGLQTELAETTQKLTSQIAAKEEEMRTLEMRMTATFSQREADLRAQLEAWQLHGRQGQASAEANRYMHPSQGQAVQQPATQNGSVQAMGSGPGQNTKAAPPGFMPTPLFASGHQQGPLPGVSGAQPPLSMPGYPGAQMPRPVTEEQLVNIFKNALPDHVSTAVLVTQAEEERMDMFIFQPLGMSWSHHCAARFGSIHSFLRRHPEAFAIRSDGGIFCREPRPHLPHPTHLGVPMGMGMPPPFPGYPAQGPGPQPTMPEQPVLSSSDSVLMVPPHLTHRPPFAAPGYGAAEGPTGGEAPPQWPGHSGWHQGTGPWPQDSRNGMRQDAQRNPGSNT